MQIRTIAMDFWASLEHQLKYKQQIENQPDIIAQLKECADASNATDEKMLAIRQRIESYAGVRDEREILLRKLTKPDVKIY